jgi:putative transposase
VKRSKFTDEQIAFALKQAELGIAVAEVCRKMGISDATFYKWRAKYAGVGSSELRRLRQLAEENRKLKQIVAELSLDKAMLQAVVAKSSLRPSQRRDLVPELMQRFGCSQRNALRIVGLSFSTCRYESRRRDEAALKMRIKEITDTRVHYGYRRVHVMLRREGHQDNVKRVYRLYRAEGLSLRLKRPRRNKAAKLRQPKQIACAINEVWSMDFVADALFDGRKLRMLAVVDCYTRECLAIDVGQSLKGEDVVNTLNRICAERGLPRAIKTDNGSEFISKVMDKWAYERRVELDFSRPGKPTDNARVESFNGRLHQECLNAHWFLSMDDARDKIAAWRTDYNESRPHSALDWATPAEFARNCRLEPAIAIPEEPEVATSERY